jgi:hypothetical protein
VTNPYRNAAPWVRLVALLAVGAAVLYALGRWDAYVDSKLAQLRRDTQQALAVSAQLRAQRDSLRSIEDSLAAVDRALQQQEQTTLLALAALDSVAQAEADSVESAELSSLLQPLRMRPILQHGDTLYATDSAGVRFLSHRLLQLAQAERERDELRVLADTRADRIAALFAQVGAAQSRADTAEARIAEIEPLLERWQDVESCRILWLLPCPSRTTAFVIGGLAGGAAVYLGSRE